MGCVYGVRGGGVRGETVVQMLHIMLFVSVKFYENLPIRIVSERNFDEILHLLYFMKRKKN